MRVHNILLYMYPSSFRSEYGAELSSIFHERRLKATNPFSIFFLWIAEFFDIIGNAAHVHWDILRQDLRYTARAFARAPGFVLTAIVVTGLGIGANTAVFSVTDRALLHPLPFADADRLVQLWQRTPAYARVELSPPNFYDWRKRNTSFEAMAAYSSYGWNFPGQGEPQRLEGTAVTPDFFRILSIQPLLGRVFSADDGREAASRTVILSYSFWQNTFSGQTDVLGRTIRLDSDSYTVIGVMPPDFVFPVRTSQVWVPLILGDPPTEARDNLFLRAIAKLKPGISMERARSEMAVIADGLARDYPKENYHVVAGVDLLSEQVPNQTRTLLWALLGASLCVLLIACTNLANLLLAKALSRRKELTVRSAIGAGRERLLRQLLTESMALAVAGGVLGVLVAILGLPLLSAILPARLPLIDAKVLDWRVLAFTAFITLGTG